MSLPVFYWQRRWLRQDEDAYTDETSRLALAGQSSTFPEIASFPCLVLLGSPGIGKSHELAAAYKDARARGHRALLVLLREVRGPHDLQTKISESLEELAPDRPFSLFLDGLDEAAVPI